MGDAQRRKELGLPPRKNKKDFVLPKLDKESIQKTFRSSLYKYPIIPMIFYGVAFSSLVCCVYNLNKVYILI